jgi:hypothetical protein
VLKKRRILMYESLNEERRRRSDSCMELLQDFEAMTRDPMATQERVLLDLLQKNKDTEYGRKMGFADIRSIEDYLKKVPLNTYDDFAPYIERMAGKGERNLISANPPFWYNKTSGTVGVPKKIPYTEKVKESFDRYASMYQQGMLLRMLGDDFYGGRSLNLTRCSNSVVKMPDGIPFGPISETVVIIFRDRWNELYSTPVQATFAGKGTDVRYLNARYTLADRELNNIDCTFTGFLLDFCRYIEKNWELLVKDIEEGTIDESVELPEDLREELTGQLKPMPERAAELKAIFSKGFTTPFMPQAWPLLRYVASAASAGFARYTDEVRSRYLGTDVAFYYRGILSSEGIFSVPVGIAEHQSCLIPDSLFYEFIPQDDVNADPVTMDQVEVGKKYELVISTYSGLYRYRMRDVFLVTGFYHATPMVEYQYRIDKTISLMGEKTTEKALRVAAENTAKECGFLLVDSSVYPDTDDMRYIYIMELDRVPEKLQEEDIISCLEKNLALANPSYGAKIENGLIKTVKILFAQPETYVLYKEMMLMKGISVAQLKPVTVISNEIQRRFFFAMTEEFEEVKEETGV